MKALSHPVEQLAAVAAVHPDQAQLLTGTAEAGQQEPCAIAILDRSGGDDHRHQESQGIHEQVPLASIDQFGLVEAPNARHGRRFDALAVQTTRRGLLMPAGLASHLRSQRVMDPLPSVIIPPVAEVAIHTLPGWVFFRQHPPLDAADDHVQDGIDDLPHLQAAGASARFGRWDQILDNVPLAVGQVGRVKLCVHNCNLYHRLAVSLYFQNSFL